MVNIHVSNVNDQAPQITINYLFDGKLSEDQDIVRHWNLFRMDSKIMQVTKIDKESNRLWCITPTELHYHMKLYDLVVYAMLCEELSSVIYARCCSTEPWVVDTVI